ncbi:MAG: hypothetical protein GXP39_10200 [Chloroflexi bacterium]|nr:hypothetical protein [Chloroflexota bacterium]
MSFLIGVTYWPRRKATGWWQRFDRGEVVEELAHIAAMGCHAVRLPLLWSAVQPTVDRLEHRVLDRLGDVLDAAEDAGLRAFVDLQVGLACGAFHFPDWAMDFPPAEPPVFQVVSGRAEARYRLRDPFEDEKLVNAQQRLFREVIGYYDEHPAVLGWSLGHELDRARPPRDPDAAAEWLDQRSTEIREVAEEARLLWYADASALTRPVGVRPADVAEVLGALAVEVYPNLHPTAEHPLDEEVARFTVALMRALAPDVPIWVVGCAVPTVPVPGDPGTMIWDLVDRETREIYFASETEQAEFVERVLEGLIADGVEGCWLGHYADFDEALWEDPPLDRCRRARVLGLVRRDGSEKPAAESVRRIHERLQAGELKPGQPERRLELDPREYWQDPERHLPRLYEEYQEGGHG